LLGSGLDPFSNERESLDGMDPYACRVVFLNRFAGLGKFSKNALAAGVCSLNHLSGRASKDLRSLPKRVSQSFSLFLLLHLVGFGLGTWEANGVGQRSGGPGPSAWCGWCGGWSCSTCNTWSGRGWGCLFPRCRIGRRAALLLCCLFPWSSLRIRRAH
jgi:hypothetical protein